MNAKDLRIVFMGTPEFAVPSLRALVRSGYNVVGVVTTPDKPAGRGQKLHESDVKIAARELGLPIPATGEVARSGLRQYDGGVAA